MIVRKLKGWGIAAWNWVRRNWKVVVAAVVTIGLYIVFRQRPVDVAKRPHPVKPRKPRISLGNRSERALKGVHPDLVRVVRRAASISTISFIVTEGRRSYARQIELVKRGASKTLNSRHLTGHAVDIAPVVAGKVRWDWPLLKKLSTAFKQAAELENVSIEWGGDWKSFKDGPHYQLPWRQYPGARRGRQQ